MAEWELNYADREALRTFLVPRLTQAVTKYFVFILGGGGSPSPARLTYVKENIANVAPIAHRLSVYCMSEPTFIAGGTSISDLALQSRAETVLNSDFLPA